jgi:repressor LexA
MDAELTKRQASVFGYIRETIEERGYGPTVREIAEEFGMSSPNGAMGHIRALTKKGFIKRTANRSRSIELTEMAHDQYDGLPLLGVVAAGTMHEAIEQSDRIVLDDMFAGKSNYVLEVSGDSMIDAQIADGDFIVVQRKRTAHKGDIVVARTSDGEATVKYWFPEKNRIRLQPANKNMKPIYSKDARVIGLVIGVVRNMR